MIGRVLRFLAGPFVALVAVGPIVDRFARRLTEAPRRLPEESGMVAALDALGGEVVRLRARDGVRLTARWLAADPRPGSGDAGEAAPGPAVGDTGEAWITDPREAILLLHGYSGSVTPDLVGLGPFLRRTAGVLGLDFRGHGGSDDAPTTFGMLEVEDIAGALSLLGERGVRRVALVGSSMGGIAAIAAVAILGDGRLPSADADPDAPAAAVGPPAPTIVAVVGDSVPPELSVVVGQRMRMPFARVVAERAFGHLAPVLGGDPRSTQPIRSIALLEDVPLLLIHGDADRTVPIRDGRRLAAASPAGAEHLVIRGAGHSRGHETDPGAYEAAVTGFLRRAFGMTRP